MAIQWHPLFAYLLRPLVEGYYEVLTNVAVGDVPREADLVLLRRTTEKERPFRGIWQHLTKWNILEYKGPTDSARLEHIDLLVELGLGIHRRLNHEAAKNRKHLMNSADVSLWYLASHLGRRFLDRAKTKVGDLESLSDGIWRGSILERQLFFVSGTDLPVENDSVPFHILGVESPAQELEAARLIIRQPDLWELYSQFLGTLHSATLKELIAMARTSKKGPKFEIKPLVDFMGMTETIEQIGPEQVIKHFISDAKRKRQLLAALLPELSAAERAELKKKLDA